ncbi:molybdenum cofactor biosynthesis protein MoaE [Sphingomonas bacterium]|uniref:molybdenum cofactor biosynthesis protein MoaE n=1 Tax=Sphingomonas bacterium TaxID=1895847 RepID=UPI0026703ED1|nr:molybdenum cofactor biosynthesis protein MoaE [Sphingomonas bacterium]
MADGQTIRVSVQREAIDLTAEIARMEGEGAGGIATFCGHVRADADATGGGVTSLELEHYPGATEAALLRLATTAAARWSLTAASVIHRVGPMAPGTRIVLVATAAAHRAAALEACAYLIDRLKTDAPFWKREVRGGDARWVEARGGDEAAAARWE